MSVRAIITNGYGSGGGTSKIITDGFLSSSLAVVRVDTHDGFDSKRHRQRKESQDKRRQDIESAFRVALGEPDTQEHATEILHEYTPVKADSVDSVDWEALQANQRHVDWLFSVLRRKEETELEEIAVIMTMIR